jgi:ornithine cyclodeaminase
VIERDQIERVLEGLDLAPAMARAFMDWSEGRAQLAAVGELVFSDPPGDVHIKAGHVRGEDVYLVKIASGFYHNPERGLPSSSGLSLLFDARTGEPRTLLLDDGRLTDERTAAAGALAARWLARPGARTIAMLGGGIQARLQLKHLRAATPARHVIIWARRAEACEAVADAARALGFTADVAASPGEAARAADIIVTTTPSETPLIDASDARPGAHITAVGADSAHKGELAPDLLLAADLIVADSLVQCRARGELRRAEGRTGAVCELGAVIAGRHPGRARPDDITIADLTGLAVQDIAIARAVLAALGPEEPAP